MQKKGKINVLLISGSLEIAGAETFLMNLVRTIDKKRFQVDFLLFTTQETRYTEEARELGCNIFSVTSRSKSLFKYFSDLNKFFKENIGKYNVVHFNTGNLTTIAPLRYAKRYGVPVRVVHSHSTSADGFHNRLLHAIHKRIIGKFATNYWACSSGAAKYFFGNKESKIIKNGLKVSLYKFDNKKREQIRSEFCIPEDSIVVGHVGRFATLKNQQFLIKTFKEIHSLQSNSYLLLIGEGSRMDYNKQLANVLLGRDADHVIFAGLRADIPEIMSAFDIFVMPSIYEGLPYVLVEAQAAGLPCIASDTINIDSKLSSKFKFLSLGESPKYWASEIIDLSKSSTRDNRDFLKSGFAMEDTIPYIESVYAKNNYK